MSLSEYIGGSEQTHLPSDSLSALFPVVGIECISIVSVLIPGILFLAISIVFIWKLNFDQLPVPSYIFVEWPEDELFLALINLKEWESFHNIYFSNPDAAVIGSVQQQTD